MSPAYPDPLPDANYQAVVQVQPIPTTNVLDKAAPAGSPDPDANVGQASQSNQAEPIPSAPTVAQIQQVSQSSPSLLGVTLNALLNANPLTDPSGPAEPATASQTDRGQTPADASSSASVAGTYVPVHPADQSNGLASSPAGGGAGSSISVNAAENTAFGGPSPSNVPVSWFDMESGPVTIKYDFRSENGVANEITETEKSAAVTALQAWSTATGGKVNFVQDTDAPASQIVNIGTGDLSAFNFRSQQGGLLAVGGAALNMTSGQPQVTGVMWMDRSEAWDTTVGNGNLPDTIDFFTVVGHETGHILGFNDTSNSPSVDMMYGGYEGERSAASIAYTSQTQSARLAVGTEDAAGNVGFQLDAMSLEYPQISQLQVQATLQAAAGATSSEDAIIAIVDRNGNVLGVRVEQNVLNTITDPQTLAFAIDGAIAEARTAAFFSSGDPTNIDGFSPGGSVGPITSRTVRFISQSTVTQREVESNSYIADLNSTQAGPGYVAPIGLGGHFPPEIADTPPVDLFAIEHSNRDLATAGGRFNIDPAYIPPGQTLSAPLSYGAITGAYPNVPSRGIGTLPGGVPLFVDTTGDGVGDTLVGGIGVFFPGPDGFATHEQGFVPGIGQTEEQRTDSPLELEAEYMALIGAGGSLQALQQGAEGAKVFGSPFDVPFPRLDLVGIQLQVVGPTAGIVGVEQLISFAKNNLTVGSGTSGVDMPLQGGMPYNDGQPVPSGWLVIPHASAVDNISAADVETTILQGINAATQVRSAIRATSDGDPGARSRMVLTVTDSTGTVLGLYRMQDATYFSIDVAVAKARNMAYYADPAALQPVDEVEGILPGVAFSSRTFRFLAEPRFPSGVNGSHPPQFSILNDPGVNPLTAENLGAPVAASAFNTVLGYDSFHPGTNFRDPSNPENQNGIIFFPGSTPYYQGSTLVGGFGVSGDGVDQDDVVTYLAAQGHIPNGVTVLRADQVNVDGVRLPFMKFNRNPFG